MSIGELYSAGFISYCKHDDLKNWYETEVDDEIIEFKNSAGKQLQLNSLLIEAEEEDVYIRILPSDYVLCIPANENRAYDFEKLERIQVMNYYGTRLRWSGMYY